MSESIYYEDTIQEFGVAHNWYNATIKDSIVTSRGTKVEMVERPQWGLACYMDNSIQSGTIDEKIYHEALVHPVMSSIQERKRVMIIGGGDSAMAFALYDQYELSKLHHQLNDMQYKHYLNWSIPFNKAIDKKINYVSGKIYHLWHGTLKNRQYFKRYDGLSKLEFNPFVDIKINEDGIWELRKEAHDLKNYLIEYFKKRKEHEFLL